MHVLRRALRPPGEFSSVEESVALCQATTSDPVVKPY